MATSIEYGLMAALVATAGVVVYQSLAFPDSSKEASVNCYQFIDELSGSGFGPARKAFSDGFLNEEECDEIRVLWEQDVLQKQQRTQAFQEKQIIDDIKKKYRTSQ